MSLRTLIESILLENEIDNIIKNKKKELEKSEIGLSIGFSDTFDKYAKLFIDKIPTPKKYISKYFDISLEIWNDSNMTADESFNKALLAFERWMSYKKSGLITKDIMVQDYVSMLDTFIGIENREYTKREEKKINTIYEDKRWLVIKVNSMLASCKYGQNTKWCISATKHQNRYEGYSKDNLIYFIIDKNDRVHNEDDLYKIAILVNKKSNKLEFWDASDELLTPQEANIVKRYIPEIIEGIEKDAMLAKDDVTKDFIKNELDDYSLKSIKDYKRTQLYYKTDGFKLVFEKPNTNHFIEVDVNIENNSISPTFYVKEIINNKETGERYYGEEYSLISIVSNEKITKSNFKKLLRELVIDLLKKPEVVKYFKENPKEYFKSVDLYKDIENFTGKVPQEAFIKAVKLLKEKGEQNITTIRRIVDPKLQASHNVKPLLKSLYNFGLITLERRGNNVMIIPTPKLIKTPLNKII